MRRLIIGDIHGCFDEVQELIEKAALTEDDEIIAVGDIVDRGPDSPRVLDFFRKTANASSLKGNHERKHVRSYRGQTRAAPSQQITRLQLGRQDYPDAVSYMDGLPHYLELAEARIVHGFFEPGLALDEQREQVIVGVMSGDEYLKATYDRPWYELYPGDKPLIVGHHDYRDDGQPFLYKNIVWGIDTGCCHGRRLTGLLLPEFEIVSVAAHANHWSCTMQQYSFIRLRSSPLSKLRWKDAESMASVPKTEPDLPEDVQEQLSRVREMMGRVKRLLWQIEQYVLTEHEAITAELRRECPYDELSPDECERLYAQKCAASPIRKYLRYARRGKLNEDTLRRSFRRPWDVLGLAQHLGLD
jgi:serine/threonine protein phosphatase 1